MTHALRILMDQRHYFLALSALLLVVAVVVGGWLAALSLAGGAVLAIVYDRSLQ